MSSTLLLIAGLLIGLLISTITFEEGDRKGYRRGRKEGMEHTAQTLREIGAISERTERITKGVAEEIWGEVNRR